jgi:2-dehydropantoate 2-reductase
VKICIYGAGAIGGLLAAKLARAGQDVTVIARGPHLAAIKARGLKLFSQDEEILVRPRAVEDPNEAGPQDHVIVAVKATGVVPIAERMGPLLGPGTAVVTAMNGIPWWYFWNQEGPWKDRQLASIDPGGQLWRAIPPARCIGCVVYPAAEIVEPGVVRHGYGNRFMLGEPSGQPSERVKALSQALTQAGFKAPVRPKIRDDIWLKLWGNLSLNVVSALTHGTLAGMANDPAVYAVLRAMMVEAETIARSLGVELPVDVDTRIAWARDVGEHKTSMLQDLEQGRPMEIDALTGVIAEMGDLVGIETPTIDTVLALVRQRARVAGSYPPAVLEQDRIRLVQPDP